MANTSVYDEDMDLVTVSMKEYCHKPLPRPWIRHNVVHDDCLIVGFGRDSLKPVDKHYNTFSTMCQKQLEYYKPAVERFKKKYPKMAKSYFDKELDPTPIEHEIQDYKRTNYLISYCSRDLPFMSVNLNRRAKALQTLRLPDDIEIPCTSQTNSYRWPPREKFVPPKTNTIKPQPTQDDKLRNELRRITRVETGESNYGVTHGLLGKVVLDKNPYGPPRQEPKYGRWRSPFIYSYQI